MISDIKTSRYRVGIRASVDISKYVAAELAEGGYYVVDVASPEEAGKVLRELIEKGVLVTEMKQLDNPLQELFDTK